jgi:ComF family protein
MKNWLDDLVDLFYPSVCQCCEAPLVASEKFICLTCYLELPEMRLPTSLEGPLHNVFFGRVPIAEGAALYRFEKDSPIQKIMHAIKYKGNQKLAGHLGGLMGEAFRQQNFFSTVNAIVPVPLHPKKQRKRGFNQSAVIASGIADKLGIQMDQNLVYRNTFTTSQTKKSRFARWENVATVFSCDARDLNGQHFLLVDDVLTTGATLEACAQPLLQKGAKISIATLAMVV